MPLTFHHPGADEIPRDRAHALLHTKDLALLRLSPESFGRICVELCCDRLHQRLTVEGVPHVCQVHAETGAIQQMWVMDPKAVLNGGI